MAWLSVLARQLGHSLRLTGLTVKSMVTIKEEGLSMTCTLATGHNSETIATYLNRDQTLTEAKRAIEDALTLL